MYICRKTVEILFNPLLGDKWVLTFYKVICLKVKIPVCLVFEFIYFEVAVQHFIFNMTKTPLIINVILPQNGNMFRDRQNIF